MLVLGGGVSCTAACVLCEVFGDTSSYLRTRQPLTAQQSRSTAMPHPMPAPSSQSSHPASASASVVLCARTLEGHSCFRLLTY